MSDLWKYFALQSVNSFVLASMGRFNRVENGMFESLLGVRKLNFWDEKNQSLG